MSRFIHKSHNVSVLLYHVVCVAKYRRVVFDAGALWADGSCAARSVFGNGFAL